MFAKKYGILVAVDAILIKLCFNLFVVVRFWPIFHMYVLHKKSKIAFLAILWRLPGILTRLILDLTRTRVQVIGTEIRSDSLKGHSHKFSRIFFILYNA
jgi:hypothetical protein